MAALVLAVLPSCRLAALSAQENPTIKTAQRLAAEGHSDSARALVGAVLAHARPGDSSYVEALYWRGRFSMTGDSAERDLRRVALDFPDSRYAAPALLQLSQLALASGNAASAFGLATRMRSDYPGSDLRARAALWAGRAAFEVGEPRAACAYLDTARTEAGADIEFANQVRFYQARCTPELLAAPPPDTTKPSQRADSAKAPTGAAPAAPATPPAAAERYDVQVAASSHLRDARAIQQRLARAHRTAHIVHGDDGLYRVRVGPFAGRAAADSAAHALRGIAGGTPFAVRLP